MNESQNIVVTGGAGFIGSHLVRRLVGGGNNVFVLTKETSNLDRIKDLLPNITVLRDDMSDSERLKKILAAINPHGVFHLAASTIKSGVAAPEDELIKTNIQGTVHLVSALQEIDYSFFINSGTLLEYGTKEHPPRESNICEPVEIYALSKLAGTLYCQAIARSYDKPIITFRIFTPYGPGMETGRLAYEVVKRALYNEEIILTRPEVNRDFIFVDDLVNLYIEAMDKAATCKGEIFNLATGHATTLKDFTERVLALTGSKSVVHWGGAKDVSYDRACWEADMTKTFTAFTWRPKYDLDTGIKRMMEWFASKKKA